MGLLELYPYLSRHSNYSPRTNKCQMFKKHLNTQQKLPGYMASQKKVMDFAMEYQGTGISS
jgi:hypothetical protein